MEMSPTVFEAGEGVSSMNVGNCNNSKSTVVVVRWNFDDGRPASHFDTFVVALLTVFQVRFDKISPSD